MSALRDLEDYKLHAEFDRRLNIVLHRSYRADWARGRQRVVVEERWAPQKPALGAGSFGNVRLEKREDAGGEAQFRAVKELRKIDLERMRIDFRKELIALTKFSRSKFVQSQAFVKFFGWFEDDNHLYFAMEYFQHGTLDRFISESLSENEAKIIAQQLLEGLRIMHEEQFTHRDLKPQNIFIVQKRPNWWVKIGDFGMSKRVAQNSTILQSKVGTPLYIAPEIFHYVPALDEEVDAYTNVVDVWSFACVVYEMMALNPPFMDWPRTLVKFCNGGAFPDAALKARTSPLGIEFVKSVLIPLPEHRPTAKEALGLPWFDAESPSAPHRLTVLIGNEDFSAEGREIWRRARVDSHMNPNSSPDEERTISLARRKSYSATLEVPQVSETVSGLAKSKSAMEIGLDHSATDVMGNENTAAFPGGKLPLRSVPTLLDAAAVSSKGANLSSSCESCKCTIKENYYHCTICKDGDFSLCAACVMHGRHCNVQDHWMLKSIITNGKVLNSVTDVVRTRWSLRPIEGAIASKPPVPSTLSSRRWISSYKKPRPGQLPYDYCFQCGVTFPVDRPPHRHEWEQHGTLDFPIREAESANKSTSQSFSTYVWQKALLPEEREEQTKREREEREQKEEEQKEQKLHEDKLLSMEEEMKTVFDRKVKEKQGLLEKSETDLTTNYHEIKGSMDLQREQLLKKKEDLVNRPKRKGVFSFRS